MRVIFSDEGLKKWVLGNSYKREVSNNRIEILVFQLVYHLKREIIQTIDGPSHPANNIRNGILEIRQKRECREMKLPYCNTQQAVR
jgi:lysophospholipid acyltransferase (LPLAT)-like uncharacterized protein